MSRKMAELRCYCSVTRNCVFIPQDREEHIIRRHYFWNAAMDPRYQRERHAFFFQAVIPPEDLFLNVTHALRSGLLPHERSGDCYTYLLHFPYDVGYFPYRLQGRYITNTVKIVCKYRLCQFCFQHCPLEVKTIYPWT